MRVEELSQQLKTTIQDYIEQAYNLTSGTESGWNLNLTEERRRFFREDYPLIKNALIEGIPQYETPQGWDISELYDDLEGLEKEEMKAFADAISLFTEFDLYPHQQESVRAYQKGEHIVVATGTGSGKTECFLYPILSHLVRESRRTKSKSILENKELLMERGIKAMVLYPMNALVADQLIRLRKMLGKLDMAEYLRNSGSGRYVQFGMYTGRTPAHGWYSRWVKEDEWVYNPNVKNKIDPVLKGLEKIRENHKELWDKMLKQGRIPAKGGVFYPLNDNSGKYSFEQLPAWAKDESIKLAREKGLDPNQITYNSRDDWTLEHYRNGLDKKGNSVTKGRGLMYLGTEGDREFYSRQEMHLGGSDPKS